MFNLHYNILYGRCCDTKKAEEETFDVTLVERPTELGIDWTCEQSAR